MRVATGLVLLAVGLSAAGCVSTKATRLGAANTATVAVAPENVAIYRTPAQVPGPYEEVALLNSSGDSLWTSERGMFESMRKKAASLGADAVILDNLIEPGSGAKVAAAIFGVSAQRKGQSIAIKMKPAQ